MLVLFQAYLGKVTVDTNNSGETVTAHLATALALLAVLAFVAVRARYPAFLTFSPYGEMLPNPKSFIDLDETKKDGYGLPLARRHVF